MKTFILTCVVQCTSLLSIAQNVGIGNTSPEMRLHISKADSATLLLENTQPLDVNVNAGLNFKMGGKYTGSIRTIGTSSADSKMSFFTYATITPNILKERMVITDGGYVGIGNSSPTAALSVSRVNGATAAAEFKGVSLSSLFNSGANEDTYIRGGANGSKVFINDIGPGNIILASGGGNVGIGTSTPGYDLDVNGTFRSVGKASIGSLLISDGTPAALKVLTSSDALGNASWAYPPSYNTGFRVGTSASVTNIAYGSYPTLLFSTTNAFSGKFDDGNNFNNSINAYVAPAAGVYQFNTTITLVAGTAVSAGYVSLEALGTGNAQNLPNQSVNVAAGAPLPRELSMSFITKMNAGDRVYFRLYNALPNTTIGGGGGQSYFSGVRLY